MISGLKNPYAIKLVLSNSINQYSPPYYKNIEPVAMEYVNQIEFTNKNVKPILTSSTNSNHSGLAPIIELNMSFNFDEKNPKLNQNINNPENKLCYAALAEGKFNSYSYNRVAIKDTANPNAQKLRKKQKSIKNIRSWKRYILEK